MPFTIVCRYLRKNSFYSKVWVISVDIKQNWSVRRSKDRGRSNSYFEWVESILLVRASDLDTVASSNIKEWTDNVWKAANKPLIEISKSKKHLHICPTS